MSVPTPLRSTLATLMKDISDGLQLDSADRYEDAYRKYLECLLRMTTTLLKKLHNDGGHLMMTKELYKTVKLGQQCMDRVSAIVNDKYVPCPDTSKRSTDNMSLPLTSVTSMTPQATPTTPSPQAVISTRLSGSTTPSPSLERSITGVSGSVRQTVGTPVIRSKSGELLSPMALASRQNQQLLLAFKARQSQAQKRRDLSLSTNLSLSLQRKMAENLAIAKAQEEALAKKMLERQARLEEQAARRFGTPVGLSEEEQQQRQIYRRTLQFELDQPHMKEVRLKFEENPTDIELISQLLSAVLRCDKHPLTEQLKTFQDTVLDKLQPLVCKKIPDIEKIRVPLSEDLYEKFKAKMKSLGEDEDIDETAGDLDVIIEESDYNIKENENNNKHNQEICDNDKLDTEEEISLAGDKSMTDKTSEVRSDVVRVVEDVRKDIEIAAIKGEKLRKRLEDENESMKSLALYTAGEYDKYNQENMDDLFDDDDDDDEEEEMDNTSVPGDSVTETKPEKTDTDDKTADTVRKSSSGSVGDEFDELRIEAYKRHLKGVVEDILTSVEQLAVLFVVVYDKLDSAEGKDQCNAELEASFFRPLWKYLLALFRLSNASSELKLAVIMTEKQGCDPAHFSVRQKLCLAPATQDSPYPYEAAVTELLGVVTFHTMLQKLECIVRTSKLVLQCVEQYYMGQNTPAPSMGADDLIPVLCYVVVRSGLPQIVSECQAVERFLHEGYMFGEEGYCLTSFQTAIDYLTSDRCLSES